MDIEDKISQLQFQPKPLDLILALISAFILPLICMFLFNLTGALIPLIIYYLVFCIGLVKWRKGSLEYSKPLRFFTPLFIGLLVFETARVFISMIVYSFTLDLELSGFLLTLFIWAPINAFMEQLIWIYVYDSFANYYSEGKKRTIFVILGWIIYFSFIGLIHVLFWARFLFESEFLIPWSIILILSQFVIAAGYLLVYKQSKSMVPVFILHLIVDVAAVILTGYSIISSLIQF